MDLDPLFQIFLVWSALYGILFAINRWAISKRNGGSLNAAYSLLSRVLTPFENIHFRPGYFYLENTEPSETRLLKRVRDDPSSKLANILRQVYSLGALLSLAAYLTLPLLLVSQIYLLATAPSSISDSQLSNAQEAIQAGLAKRAPITPAADSEDLASTVTLLIPGKTTPLGDLPVVLLATFVCIAWHELGHAAAAAVEAVPLSSYGFMLFFIFPSAYVSLPENALSALPSPAKMRILMAGVWHNLLLWILLYLGTVANLGIGNSILRVLYSDMNDQGVVVQWVDPASPLSSYLTPRTPITHLDDVSLHDSLTYRHWDNYLLDQIPPGLATHYQPLGFCVMRDNFYGRSDACCHLEASGTLPSSSSGRNELCLASPKASACLDSTAVYSKQRCIDDCPNDEICAYIDKGAATDTASLLRITIKEVSSDQEKLVFFRGEKQQLWREVKVGNLRSGRWWIPQGLPLMLDRFWIYLSSITLGLFFLNLLPLPRLDGDEVLSLLLNPYSPLQYPVQTKSSPASGSTAWLENVLQSVQASSLVMKAQDNGSVVKRSVNIATGVLIFALGCLLVTKAG